MVRFAIFLSLDFAGYPKAFALKNYLRSSLAIGLILRRFVAVRAIFSRSQPFHFANFEKKLKKVPTKY